MVGAVDGSDERGIGRRRMIVENGIGLEGSMAAMLESFVRVDTAGNSAEGVWASIARNYAAFASPFVPCREDIATYERAVASQAELRSTGGFKALMLGVTPGVARMQWPLASQVVAVEKSQAVVDALWPGDVPHVRKALCASWLDIPWEKKAFDVAVGDGSLSTCRFPEDVRELSRYLADMLVDDGVLVARTYVRPEVQESVGAVFEALFGGESMNVDCFKMRLYVAMQRSLAEGVAVRDAVEILDRFGLDRSAMKERLGWSDAAIEPFSKWRFSDAVYSFPTLDELLAVLNERFTEVSVTFPGYELGNCCPTVVMRSRGGKRWGGTG